MQLTNLMSTLLAAYEKGLPNMLDLLLPPWPTLRSKINFPRLNYNKDKLKLNWDKSKNYYRTSSLFAPSNHLLIQILSSITIDKTQTPFQYYSNLNESELYYARIHGIVNDASNAKALLNGYFYGGRKSIEVYVLDMGEVDLNTNWQEWQPVKLLSSNFIDYSYSIPERGNIPNNADGFSIISINIKMLAMQYYFYLLSDTDMLDADVKRNIGSFVMRYPLCNMLPSVIDCSYINEFRKILIGTSMHDIKETNPIALNTHSYMFDKTLSDITNAYKSNRGYTIITAVTAIPMIFSDNPLMAYGFKHYLTNTNNIWIIAYLQYTLLLLGIGLSPTNAINEKVYKDTVREIKIIRNGNFINSGSRTLAPKINETVDLLFDLVN